MVYRAEQRAAELLDDWIQRVIQAIKPWMSSKDIDRGALWFTEINEQLLNTAIEILCLTKENKNKPWILFEAGALAKGLSSGRVIPLLIDLKSTDLENPLAQFNFALPDRDGVWNLIRSINLNLKDSALSEKVLLKVFSTYWNQFEPSFKQIIDNKPENNTVEERKGDDIILEVLSTVRTLDKRLRNIENREPDFSKLSYTADSFTKPLFLNLSNDEYISNLIPRFLNTFSMLKVPVNEKNVRHLLKDELTANKILISDSQFENLVINIYSRLNEVKKPGQ